MCIVFCRSTVVLDGVKSKPTTRALPSPGNGSPAILSLKVAGGPRTKRACLALGFQAFLRVHEAINAKVAFLAESPDVVVDGAEWVAVAEVRGGEFDVAFSEESFLPVALDASVHGPLAPVLAALARAFASAPGPDCFDPSREQKPAFRVKVFVERHYTASQL